MNTMNNFKSQKAIAYVDGSYVEEVGYGSGVYLIYGEEEYEISGIGKVPEYLDMKNVSGEIIAAMLAVRKACELGAKELILYHDYTGIANWATGEWAAKKEQTRDYRDFMNQASQIIDIKFQKVKGHSNIEGNDKADQLARKMLIHT